MMATVALAETCSDKLYTLDNIVLLWLLYPYRIITLGSNKQNGDDAPWSS